MLQGPSLGLPSLYVLPLNLIYSHVCNRHRPTTSDCLTLLLPGPYSASPRSLLILLCSLSVHHPPPPTPTVSSLCTILPSSVFCFPHPNNYKTRVESVHSWLLEDCLLCRKQNLSWTDVGIRKKCWPLPSITYYYVTLGNSFFLYKTEVIIYSKNCWVKH